MTSTKSRTSGLDRDRVIAVEWFSEKGRDAFAGMLFRQDNGTVLSIRLFEDCSFQTSSGFKQTDLKAWSYPIATPRF